MSANATTSGPEPWREFYPFASHYHELPCGNRMHYLDEGSGSPVVMVHGNPTWSFFYRDAVLAWRDSHRCLVPDHLGCGLSDKPQDRSLYHLDAHIRRFADWIDGRNLDQPLTLVVHDWGGAIGLGWAVRNPDRVAKLVILNTAAFPFPSIPLRIAVCRIPLLGALAVRGGNLFVSAALRMTTERPLAAAVKAGYAHPYRSWRDRIAVHEFVRDIPMSRDHRSYPILGEIAAGLVRLRDKPTWIFWGMEDWCFHPAILREWPKHLPQAQIEELSGVGHYVWEDAGREFPRNIRKKVLAN